jgi:hypothetical protein
MKRSRLPLMRRVSQIFFLLLFFALLLFTSLNFFPHDATEVQLRAPVRLFFEWDPLVAVVNALASHALYRGLLWSLLILVPTLVSGPLLLRLDLPHGHAATLCGQHAFRGEARQATH